MGTLATRHTKDSTSKKVGWDTYSEESMAFFDDHVTSGKLGGFKITTDLVLCLSPLLKALAWRGSPRHVAEALPHFVDALDLTDLLNVLANLGYSSRSVRLCLDEIDERLLPCLFIPDQGMAKVVLKRQLTGIEIYDAETESYSVVNTQNLSGTAYLFQPLEEEYNPHEQTIRQKEKYVKGIVGRFRSLIWQTLAVSFFSSLLALSTPLFIMAVYDKVVSTGSLTILLFMIAGVGIALGGDVVLRALRARMIAHMGTRMDHIIGTAIFQRILYLAPAFIERATVGAQMARLKNFEAIREFLTGPLAIVILEIPLVLIFMTVMAIMGGLIILVPIGTITLYVLLTFTILPLLRSHVSAASRVESLYKEFLIETLFKMRPLKMAGAEKIWMKRYREISARIAMRNYQTSKISAISASLSHMLIVGSGLMTLSWGVLKVFDGDMSVGGLIASMILVWRILGPMQIGFLTMTQLEQVRTSVRQVDNLLQLKPEHNIHVHRAHSASRFKGAINFNRVSLRYSQDMDPALLGVTFNVKPGEVVGLVGPNGCGKSTILKLIAGVYQPQAGAVRIDNMDIRQINPVELRHAVAYVPQQCELFFGTIAQNLRLGNPIAGDEEIKWAAEQAGVLEKIEQMSDGFSTRIGDGKTGTLPTSVAQRLSLARAYLKRAPITLLDEPVNSLDFDSDKRFIKTLQEMRGHSTVILVTHRPSHLELCDKIIVLKNGLVTMVGPIDQVRDKIFPRLL